MATAQMNRSAVSSVSLPNRISTEQQSLVLVKRLLAVSVSCITYLRGLFPEYAYGTRYLEDLCVKILREDKSCPGATQMVKWLLGCYDALQKKYLKMVMLAIYTNVDDPQTVTECYQFKFKYHPGGPVMDFSSTKGGSSASSCSSEAKKASILLVRKLYVLMQNLEPLPNNVCLTMKLFYYDEVTPMEYQPPGFKEGVCEGMMFDGEPMYLNVGQVATPFHCLKVRVTTDKERLENVGTNILKEADTNAAAPEPLPGSAKDEPQTPSRDGQKMDVSSLHMEGLGLANRDDESMKSGCRALQYTGSKSSVDGYRTRSGRLTKKTQMLDISDSQEEPCVTKRRKFSEAKDPI